MKFFWAHITSVAFVTNTASNLGYVLSSPAMTVSDKLTEESTIHSTVFHNVDQKCATRLPAQYRATSWRARANCCTISYFVGLSFRKHSITVKKMIVIHVNDIRVCLSSLAHFGFVWSSGCKALRPRAER